MRANLRQRASDRSRREKRPGNALALPSTHKAATATPLCPSVCVSSGGVESGLSVTSACVCWSGSMAGFTGSATWSTAISWPRKSAARLRCIHVHMLCGMCMHPRKAPGQARAPLTSHPAAPDPCSSGLALSHLTAKRVETRLWRSRGRAPSSTSRLPLAASLGGAPAQASYSVVPMNVAWVGGSGV